MSITTQTRTQRRVVATTEVRQSARFVHRDAGGRLDRVDEVSWLAADGLIPIAAATAMADEAIRAAAPQIEEAVTTGIATWLDRHAFALPEPESAEEAAYFERVVAAIHEGRISATVFHLPRSYWDADENDLEEGQ